jgi:hypothetical protein
MKNFRVCAASSRISGQIFEDSKQLSRDSEELAGDFENCAENLTFVS